MRMPSGVAFPASLGRDASILWCAVRSAEGMPAPLPLRLKHFSSFWTVSSVNVSFNCNHLPEMCFISAARLTGLTQLRPQSFLETRRQEESAWDLPVSWGLWLFRGFITWQSHPCAAFMARALSAQSCSDRNKYTSQLFFQIMYAVWKGCLHQVMLIRPWLMIWKLYALGGTHRWFLDSLLWQQEVVVQESFPPLILRLPLKCWIWKKIVYFFSLSLFYSLF